MIDPFSCLLQIPPRDGHPCRPAIGFHHQGPKRTCTSKSLLDHHSQTDGAYAPRAIPGAQKKRPAETGQSKFKNLISVT